MVHDLCEGIIAFHCTQITDTFYSEESVTMTAKLHDVFM